MGKTVCSLDENDNSQITTTESNVQHTGKRKQEAQLLPRDCAMRHVSWTVQNVAQVFFELHLISLHLALL